MIEVYVYPIRFVVAVGAQFRRVFLVWLIVDVTRRTVAWCITVLVTRHVAIGAFSVIVMTEQFEIRQVMIECRLIKNYDVGIPAFVIRMARGTPVISGVFRFSVKPEV